MLTNEAAFAIMCFAHRPSMLHRLARGRVAAACLVATAASGVLRQVVTWTGGPVISASPTAAKNRITTQEGSNSNRPMLARRLHFDEVDAMGSQPVAHSRPRVGLPLLPSPHALGRNDQKGQLFAVGRLDDPGQIGARGS
jgi:hypothetical protein